MARLHLISSTDDISRADDADPYGFKERFSGYSADKLIELYNREVGGRGWVTARGHFLVALREALIATGLDCSRIIDAQGMSLDHHVRIEGQALVPVD